MCAHIHQYPSMLAFVPCHALPPASLCLIPFWLEMATFSLPLFVFATMPTANISPSLPSRISRLLLLRPHRGPRASALLLLAGSRRQGRPRPPLQAPHCRRGLPRRVRAHPSRSLVLSPLLLHNRRVVGGGGCPWMWWGLIARSVLHFEKAELGDGEMRC